jgi:hypothetical protein
MSGATENADGSAKRWKHGRSVAPDGSVRFLSVSALEMADMDAAAGCLRKWWYAFLQGIREGPSPAKDRGDKLHAEVARYLRTGDRNLSSQVLVGLGAGMIPRPGDDLGVEYDMVPDLAEGSSGLELAALRVATIPMVGAIDLMHARIENPGVLDIEDTRDPPGTLKVVDWKFPSKMEHAKAGHQLADTIQMAGYAIFGYSLSPDVRRVRISHGYMPVKGTPRVATALVSDARVYQTWKRAEAIAVSIRDAARESNPDKVDANVKACHAYHRDCPARGICRAAMHNSLSSYVGITHADRLLRQMRLPSADPGDPGNMTMPNTFAPNSIFAQLQARQAAGTTPAQQSLSPLIHAPSPPMALQAVPPPGVQATPSVAPQGPIPLVAQAAPATQITSPQPSAADVQAEMARLAAQEAAQTAQLAVQSPQGTPSPMADTATLLAAIENYGSYFGIGTPSWAGAAAAEVARLKRFELAPGAQLEGYGDLAVHTISDPTQWPAVLESMQHIYTQRAHAAQPPASPTTPSPPATSPTAASSRTAAPTQTTAQSPSTPPTASGRGGGRGKARNSEQATTSTALPVATTTVNSMSPGPAVQPATCQQGPSAINLYVDCLVDGKKVTSLWPLVSHLVEAMHKDSGAPDFRLVGKDSAYAYDGWRGILASGLNNAAANGDLPPGDYVFDGGVGSSIAGLVVETMHSIVARSGGVFVRGGR